MESERVILLKGDRTKWYEQAIFIVKKNVPPGGVPVDLVAEAEKIINGYPNTRTKNYIPSTVGTGVAKNAYAITPGKGKKTKNKSDGFDLFMNFLMLGSCIVISFILLWTFR